MIEYEKKNRERLIKLVSRLPSVKCPDGWRYSGTFAIGGLTEIGFSKKSEMLLVVSGSGRGVFDCTLGTRVARDNGVDGDWDTPTELTCEGIGPIDGELLQMAGLHGGGLPCSNRRGESLEVVAPDWPKFDLIFCAPHKAALIEGHQEGCIRIASDYFVSFGFSWSGNSFVYATSSDVTVFSRNIMDRHGNT